MLKELGFKSRPELTLAIDESWEPAPDVCGILGPEEDPYPSHAVAAAIEVLHRMTGSHASFRNAGNMRHGVSRTSSCMIRSSVMSGTGIRLPAA